MAEDHQELVHPTNPANAQSAGQDSVNVQEPKRVAPAIARSEEIESPNALSTLTPALIKKLTERLMEARDDHDNWIDPILFNGLTILVLCLTAVAAFVPSIEGAPKWLAPACAALSGVFVAAERALGFGARWRYHRDMYYGYIAIIDMLEFYPAIPASEQSKYGRDIFTALYALRSRESAIPNAGANSSPT